jgi:hypothetical protein
VDGTSCIHAYHPCTTTSADSSSVPPIRITDLSLMLGNTPIACPMNVRREERSRIGKRVDGEGWRYLACNGISMLISEMISISISSFLLDNDDSCCSAGRLSNTR